MGWFHVQDERAEHLRGFSFLSGIVAGFIIASFLQVTFDPLQTSSGFQLAFAVTVGVTVWPSAGKGIQRDSLPPRWHASVAQAMHTQRVHVIVFLVCAQHTCARAASHA